MSLKQDRTRLLFKLAEAAKERWRRLKGHNQLPQIILGIKFTHESSLSDRKLKSLPLEPFKIWRPVPVQQSS
jgi:hypothetical protein